MLGVTYAHPAILTLIGFLLRHIASIEHSALYIVFDNQSTIQSDAIAKALQSHLITYKTIRNLGQGKPFQASRKNGIVFQKDALVISLVNEHKIVRMIGNQSGDFFEVNLKAYGSMKFMCLVLNPSEKVTRRVEKRLNLFHVVLRNDSGLDFLVWPTLSSNIDVYWLERVSDEATLVSHLDWLKFCNRVERRHLKGIQVIAVLRSMNSLQTEVILHSGSQFFTGIFVGISRIMVDYLKADQMYMMEYTFRPDTGLKQSKSIPRDVTYLDKRLTWPNNVPHSSQVYWSIGPFSIGEWMPSMTDVYVVLAPHQPVPPQTTWTMFRQRTVLFVMILGTTLGILAIRLVCRQMKPSASGPTDRDALMFDTFARTLGLSAGNWLGRSTSERQLLVVLSTFAILMGCIFSGVLYERSLPKEDEQRFNTLEEICAAGIKVTLYPTVLGTFFHTTGDGVKLGKLGKCVELNAIDMHNLSSNQGYIVSQHVGFRPDKHHILAKPFVELPVPLYVEPYFMLRHVQLVVRRCVEQGLNQAFHSAASHSKQLQLASKYNEEDYALHQKRLAGEVTYFEFKLLVVGLTVASCVFILELISATNFPSFRPLFVWIRSKLRRATGNVGFEF